MKLKTILLLTKLNYLMIINMSRFLIFGIFTPLGRTVLNPFRKQEMILSI